MSNNRKCTQENDSILQEPYNEKLSEAEKKIDDKRNNHKSPLPTSNFSNITFACNNPSLRNSESQDKTHKDESSVAQIVQNYNKNTNRPINVEDVIQMTREDYYKLLDDSEELKKVKEDYETLTAKYIRLDKNFEKYVALHPDQNGKVVPNASAEDVLPTTEKSESYKQNLEQHISEKQQLESEIKNLSDQIENYKQNLAQYELKKQQLESDIKNLIDQIENYEQNLAQYELEKQQLESDKVALVNEVNESKKRERHLESQLEKKYSEIENQYKEIIDANTEMRSAINQEAVNLYKDVIQSMNETRSEIAKEIYSCLEKKLNVFDNVINETQICMRSELNKWQGEIYRGCNERFPRAFEYLAKVISATEKTMEQYEESQPPYEEFALYLKKHVKSLNSLKENFEIALAENSVKVFRPIVGDEFDPRLHLAENINDTHETPDDYYGRSITKVIDFGMAVVDKEGEYMIPVFRQAVVEVEK